MDGISDSSMGSGLQEEGADKVAFPSVSACIMFVSNPMIRAVLRKELSKVGISTMMIAETVADSFSYLNEHPTALLVIDWEQGEFDVARVLQEAQGRHKIDTRPIYFIARQMQDKLMHVASDYNVTQVHIGEITPKNMKEELKVLLSHLGRTPRCRQVFRDVAELRSNGQLEKAEGLLIDLVRAEPTNIRAMVELGDNYLQRGDYRRAQRILDQSLEIDSTHMRAKHILARVMLKQQRPAEALELLQEIESVGILNADRMVDVGYCLMNLQRYQDALNQFDRALNISPKIKSAMVGKSQVFLMKGHINDAIQLINEVSSKIELASIFNSTAILCMRQDQFNKAIDLYHHAMAQVSDDRKTLARLMFNLGIGYFKGKRYKKAILAFGEVIELDPKFKKAEHNLKKLAKINDQLAELVVSVSGLTISQVRKAKNSVYVDVDIPETVEQQDDPIVSA